MITIYKGSIEGNHAEEYCQAMKEAIESRGWPAQIVDAKSGYQISWQCSDHWQILKGLPTYEEWEQNNG